MKSLMSQKDTAPPVDVRRHLTDDKVKLMFHWMLENKFPPPLLSATTSHLLYSMLHPQPLAEAVPVWSANYSLSELPRVCVWICICVCVSRCQQMQTGGRHIRGRKEAAVN